MTGYAIEGGADASQFSIVSATGVLTFVAAPNYEAPADDDGNNEYEVVVRATSGAGCAGEDGGPADHGDGDGRGRRAARRAQPDAPGVTAAGPTSLTVSWSEPSNSGPPVTGYDLRLPGEVDSGALDGGDDYERVTELEQRRSPILR